MRYTPSQYAKTLYDLLEEHPRKRKEIVSAFAKHLLQNGAVKDLRAIGEAFKREWYKRENIIPVEVTAAETGVFSIKELEKLAGQEIELSEKKDSNVGAGARIKIGDWQIDNTLARRLSDLKSAVTR